jgi:hypothetical protein
MAEAEFEAWEAIGEVARWRDLAGRCGAVDEGEPMTLAEAYHALYEMLGVDAGDSAIATS